MDTLTTAYTLNWHFQLRKDDAEATKLRDTTDKIITNRQNPTFLLVFLYFGKKRGRQLFRQRQQHFWAGESRVI